MLSTTTTLTFTTDRRPYGPEDGGQTIEAEIMIAVSCGEVSVTRADVVIPEHERRGEHSVSIKIARADLLGWARAIIAANERDHAGRHGN